MACEETRCHTLLLAKQSDEYVLGANMLVSQPLRFFGAIREYALGWMAEGEINGSGDFFDARGIRFYLLSDGFDYAARAKPVADQRFIRANQTQQQMLGFDFMTAELTRFVARKENHPARFFCVPFEHTNPDAGTGGVAAKR